MLSLNFLLFLFLVHLALSQKNLDCSKISLTLYLFLVFGPKLKISPFNFVSWYPDAANLRYPDKTSKTCCHGRVELRFLIITFLFFDHALTQSGISLPSDQSAPPITFPALAIEITELAFLKLKELKYDCIAISAEDLLAL